MGNVMSRIPRPRWTNRTAGMWSLIETKPFAITGTTPRNAGCFNVDISVGTYGIWFQFGKHTGITLWLAEDRCKEFHIKLCGGKCYTCRVFKPMSPETAKYISKILKNADIPVTKLPPRD